MARIVTYVHHYKRPPEAKEGRHPRHSGDRQGASKSERIRRREAADEGREVSPEEEAAAEALTGIEGVSSRPVRRIVLVGAGGR